MENNNDWISPSGVAAEFVIEPARLPIKNFCDAIKYKDI
jgi:hypothetical protein